LEKTIAVACFSTARSLTTSVVYRLVGGSFAAFALIAWQQ
jgi:hypothetical protein